MFACIFVPNFPADRSDPQAAPQAGQQALLDCAFSFSPRVEDTAPGTVVFDIDGLERLFGSFEEIASKISERVLAFGWHANVAIALNPDAAVVKARGGSRPMKDLPLEVLSPPEEILETLERWGIRTLGAFAKLPMVQVSERLGQEGLHLLKLAKGVASRPLIPHQDRLQFVESMELDYSIEEIEPLTFILARLLDQLCLRMRIRNLATLEVHLTLSGTCERVLHLPLPVRNSKLLMKLLILDLEGRPPGIGITSIKVETIPARPRVVQNGLFTPLSPEPEKLELTMARISAVVGEGNVGAAEILDTHRPDAFRVKQFGRELRHASHSGLSRPLSIRLFRPPLPFHGRILKASGPWHTSGDWWTDDRKWNREEWDVELDDGIYRIYRDVTTNRWFVDGIYD